MCNITYATLTFRSCVFAQTSAKCQKTLTKKRNRTEKRTKAGVDEAVPAAAAGAQQPLPTDTRGEAKSGAEQTHQHVTDANVQQQHVNRRPQLLEFAEQKQDDEVVQEAKSHDEAQHHGQHNKTSRGQVPFARRRVHWLPVIAQVEAVVQTSLTRKHAAVHSSELDFTLEPFLVRG